MHLCVIDLVNWSGGPVVYINDEDLPANAQNYVKMIEDAAGVPVNMIGVGPEWEPTIRR